MGQHRIKNGLMMDYRCLNYCFEIKVLCKPIVRLIFKRKKEEKFIKAIMSSKRPLMKQGSN